MLSSVVQEGSIGDTGHSKCFCRQSGISPFQPGHDHKMINISRRLQTPASSGYFHYRFCRPFSHFVPLQGRAWMSGYCYSRLPGLRRCDGHYSAKKTWSFPFHTAFLPPSRSSYWNHSFVFLFLCLSPDFWESYPYYSLGFRYLIFAVPKNMNRRYCCRRRPLLLLRQSRS